MAVDEEVVRRRQRQSAVEWIVVILVAAVAVGIVTRRPLPWITGGLAAAGLAVARGWVLAQWAVGRLSGTIAIGLHVPFLAAAALGLWVLANLS